MVRRLTTLCSCTGYLHVVRARDVLEHVTRGHVLDICVILLFYIYTNELALNVANTLTRKARAHLQSKYLLPDAVNTCLGWLWVVGIAVL